MGSQRRRDMLLQDAGVEDQETRNQLNRDIELLECAGDNFSNALWVWLGLTQEDLSSFTRHTPEEMTLVRRQAAIDLLKALSVTAEAVGRTVSFLTDRKDTDTL